MPEIILPFHHNQFIRKPCPNCQVTVVVNTDIGFTQRKEVVHHVSEDCDGHGREDLHTKTTYRYICSACPECGGEIVMHKDIVAKKRWYVARRYKRKR